MNVIKAAFTVGAFTLVSRFIGFFRECIMAFCLGASMYSDAVLVALRISNTFRRIFAEGAFNASFLPRFSKTLNNEGIEEANIVLSHVFSLLLIVLSIFSVFVISFFPQILKIFVSGFDALSEKFRLSVQLGRICFPYLIFISITSLFCGVLNTINKFALAAGVYSLLSVFTSAGLLIGYFCKLPNEHTVHLVAWCVVLSGIFQSYFLACSIKKHGFIIKFRIDCLSEKTKDIMRHMIPGIIGAGVWQFNLLVDTAISSYLPTGTIMCVNLADRLNQFPLGTLGIALSTALLPILSKLIGKQEYDNARIELERGLLFALFLTLYATCVLTSLNVSSVAVAFQRGLFTYDNVLIAADAVIGFAIGLPAYVMTKVFSTVYFAFGDTTKPVLFGIISVILNIVFLFIFVPYFKYFGLAMCTSLSAIANAIMLVYFSNKKMQLTFSKKFFIKAGAQCIASIFTYNVLVYLSDTFWHRTLGDMPIKWAIYFAFLGVSILVFFSVTVICLILSGQKDWKLWKVSAWS